MYTIYIIQNTLYSIHYSIYTFSITMEDFQPKTNKGGACFLLKAFLDLYFMGKYGGVGFPLKHNIIIKHNTNVELKRPLEKGDAGIKA